MAHDDAIQDPLAEFARVVEDGGTQRSVPTRVLIRTLLKSQGETISDLRQTIMHKHSGISAADVQTALRTAVRTGLVEVDPAKRDPIFRLTSTGEAVATRYR